MTTPSTDNPNAKPPSKRNHTWLHQQLEQIWRDHFNDVERLNTVTIRWGSNNRTRLGSISGKGGPRLAPEHSEIRINALLRDERIPESVVWQTIAHELAHYAHGFCSPHPRKYDHPHRGGVIQKELYARNLSHVYIEADTWLKRHWHNHVASTIPPINPQKRRMYGKRLSLLQNISQRLTR